VRNVPFYSFNDAEQANNEDLPILLYQGTLNKGRGLEQLINSMEHISAILNIAGEGDLSSELRQQAKHVAWKERIHFLGYQKPEELKKITQEAYIGINLVSNEGLSYYYSLSNKFFDYIMAGIPQVTMSYPEYERLNNKYHTALTISDIKEGQIINAINRLLKNKDLYNQLKGNTQLAAEELNWEKEKQELLSFYDKVR
jgi:glycosyltransferase involved in cell wall biosynthesis